MNQPCVEVYEAFEIDYTPFALPDATFRPHFVIQPPPGTPGPGGKPFVWRTAERPAGTGDIAWTENYADFDEAARVGLQQARRAVDQFRQSTPD